MRRRYIKIPSRLNASSTPQKVPGEFTLSGSAEFQANDGQEAVPVGKREGKLYLMANTGKPMQLKGYPHKVIVDMEGHSFDRAITPVIGDHNTDKRYGKTTEQITVKAGKSGLLGGRSIKGPAIAAMAIRASKTAFASELEEDAKEGYPLQVSIGTKIDDGYLIEEGESGYINGVNWEGPLIVASKSRTREITLTVLGADGETSAIISARATPGEDSMDFKAWLKSMDIDESTLSANALKSLEAQYQVHLQAQETDEEEEETPPKKSRKKTPAKKVPTRKMVKAGPDDEEEDDDDDEDTERHIKRRRGSLAAEDARIDSINATARRFEGLEVIKYKNKDYSLPSFKAHAVREGFSVNDFELECRRSEYPEPMRAPAIHANSGGKWHSQALEVAILRQTGIIPESEVNKVTGRKYGIEAMYNEKILALADGKQYRDMTPSFDELAYITIQANGHNPIARHGQDLQAQAHDVWSKITGGRVTGKHLDKIEASGFSTLLITHILENVANKSAVASFEAAETAIWRDICGRRPVNDFKLHSLYTLDLDGSFRKVATDGELKHITMRDTKRTVQAETFGAMITIDRKTRIDDDLGLVVTRASALGSLAPIRIEESVFTLLLSNPGSFFSVGNNNLLTGGGSVVSVDGILAAERKFLDQTLYGKPIQVRPTFMLTGTVNNITAGRYMKQGQLTVGGGNTDTGMVLTDNPVAGKFRVIASPYLNNTAIKNQDGDSISGQSATQWYLGGNPNSPQGSALVISFLNGRETPYFDQAETQFNVVGGIQMRSYLDWGVAMHLNAMMVKNSGA